MLPASAIITANVTTQGFPIKARRFLASVALLHHSNHDLANVIGTSAIIRRGSDMCASDIGWIVLAFAVGSGFGAIIGLSGAARIFAPRDESSPTKQVAN